MKKWQTKTRKRKKREGHSFVVYGDSHKSIIS
jgi:hypothetical protein